MISIRSFGGLSICPDFPGYLYWDPLTCIRLFWFSWKITGKKDLKELYLFFYLFINVAETKCLSCQKALISGEENKITKSLCLRYLKWNKMTFLDYLDKENKIVFITWNLCWTTPFPFFHFLNSPALVAKLTMCYSQMYNRSDFLNGIFYC